jgi:hypothetical protein
LLADLRGASLRSGALDEEIGEKTEDTIEDECD